MWWDVTDSLRSTTATNYPTYKRWQVFRLFKQFLPGAYSPQVKESIRWRPIDPIGLPRSSSTAGHP